MARDIRNMPHYQSDASHNRTLTELKRRVAVGMTPRAYDDDSHGSKNTEFTLGLCDDAIEEMRDGVYARGNHHCPHDARYFSKNGQPTGAGPEFNGCFHTCRVFQKRYRGGSVQDRIKAVQLIKEVQEAGE